MIHKTLLATILALVSTMVPALALTLPSNTMIYGQINQTIDTGHVSVGDQFTVNVISPYPNNDSRFQGAQIKGVVQSVQKAGQGRKPALQLSFYRIYVNGRWYSMTGLLQTDQKKYDSKILQQGAGALGGMLVGNALF